MDNKNSKQNNSDNLKKSAKKGSSDSKVDFLSNTDFLSDSGTSDAVQELNINKEDEFDDDDDEFKDIDVEDLEEIDDDDDSNFEEEIFIDEETSESKDKNTENVTIISRKVRIKKPKKVSEDVEEEITKLVENFISEKDVSPTELKTILEVSERQKDQFSSGDLKLTGRKGASRQETKELLQKIDEITTSEQISKANATFVLKWLKNRN